MRESLIGDIDEQFARGRSSFWYWRQVMPAILCGFKGGLRKRPFAVIGSVLVASAISVVWVELTTSFYGLIFERSFDSSYQLEFFIPFGGGIWLLWWLGAAFASRAGAQLSDSNRAVLISVLFTQVASSLWLTRDFWRCDIPFRDAFNANPSA